MEYFTVDRAAKILKCHPDTIRRLARTGVLPAKRNYRGWRMFKMEDLIRLKREREKLTE